ncbi:MAG: P-II family nitrogen regulator [Deltaproteobacteria bacterium]|jgi:nitrogen regulatory protein P-II 1|nr:P-II family nitrogen regulator [Deltaproteobacteria bacterium]
MKMIIAFIRPEALSSVKSNLYAKEIYSMSVTNVLGAGQQKGYTEIYRGVLTEVNLLKKVRLELGVPDNLLDSALEAITQGGRTGNTGDGVIFVLDIAQGLRIRTGEKL